MDKEQQLLDQLYGEIQLPGITPEEVDEMYRKLLNDEWLLQMEDSND
jgi:hypothetical protein